MRFPVDRSLPLAALTMLAACGGATHVEGAPPPLQADSGGPPADYPMVIGAPFVIDGTTYVPADTMNYDAVGRAGIGEAGGATISAAHRTLPLPSYVEVTSLESGRTILVRLERRGPMAGRQMLELSPGAAAQLGLVGKADAAVRVRRVNPPEQERAMLRAGGAAAARMDTPKPLLAALTRRLEAQGQPAPKPADVMPPALPKPVEAAKPAGKPVVTPAKPPVPEVKAPAKPKAPPAPAPAAATPVKPVPAGDFLVQVGAFANKDRAQAVAGRAGGAISPAGKVWRVRIGPFRTRAEAEAALAKARAAGYSEARIQHAG